MPLSSSKSDQNISGKSNNLRIILKFYWVYKNMLNFYFCHKAFNHVLNLESHQRQLLLSVCLDPQLKTHDLQKRNLNFHLRYFLLLGGWEMICDMQISVNSYKLINYRWIKIIHAVKWTFIESAAPAPSLLSICLRGCKCITLFPSFEVSELFSLKTLEQNFLSIRIIITAL